MDGKMGAAATHINTFEPTFDVIQEEECDTLLIYLPGFTKEQLRVQLARSGPLKISGTRPLMGDKLSSFQKDFPIQSNCDTTKISAKFEGGILYVRLPKLIVPAQKSEADQKTPPSVTTPPPSPPSPPAAPAAEQEQPTTQKTDNSGHDSTSKKDEKSTVEEKIDETVNKVSDNVAKLGDEYKQNAVSPLTKLKMGKEMMNMVLVLLFAFVIGMYSTKLVSFFKKND